MTQGVLIVGADSDAQRVAEMVTLKAEGSTPDGPLIRRVSPEQEIYVPGGGRAVLEVKTLALAVTDPSDIMVEARPAAITTNRGAPRQST